MTSGPNFWESKVGINSIATGSNEHHSDAKSVAAQNDIYMGCRNPKENIKPVTKTTSHPFKHLLSVCAFVLTVGQTLAYALGIWDRIIRGYTEAEKKEDSGFLQRIRWEAMKGLEGWSWRPKHTTERNLAITLRWEATENF